jgi:antitoxin CptB
MEGEAGRLAWRCRRGMKELDLVLTRYLRDRWPQASGAERAIFEQILELPDPLLAAYLMGRENAPDADLERVLAQLRGDLRAPLAGATAAGTTAGG